MENGVEGFGYVCVCFIENILKYVIIRLELRY